MTKKLINLAKINFAGGSGSAPVPPGPGPGPTPTPSADADVVLRDYDGSVVASYTAEEFAALTELPTPPEHEGLTFQAWNWQLADAQAYCAAYGTVEISATYITSDGKTRIYITLTEGRTSPTLGLGINGSVDVDWGDGSAHDTMTGSSLSDLVNQQHTYSQPGNYIIEIDVAEGSGIALLGESKGCKILWDGAANTIRAYGSAIKSIVIGQSVTSISTYAFQGCYGLTSISIPQSVTSISTYAFQNCYNLTSISIPQSVYSIGDYAFQNCYNLTSISIPGVYSIGEHAFQGCYGLTSISIPQGVYSISTYAFQNCYNLTSISIPQSVASIGGYAFQNCYSMAAYRIESTTPPTIQTTTFTNIPSDCLIYVPAESVEAYKSANRWSAYASQIQPMP